MLILTCQLTDFKKEGSQFDYLLWVLFRTTSSKFFSSLVKNVVQTMMKRLSNALLFKKKPVFFKTQTFFSFMFQCSNNNTVFSQEINKKTRFIYISYFV